MGNLKTETRFGVQARIHSTYHQELTIGKFHLQATPINTAGSRKFTSQHPLQAPQRPTQALQLTTFYQARRINTRGLKANLAGRRGVLMWVETRIKRQARALPKRSMQGRHIRGVWAVRRATSVCLLRVRSQALVLQALRSILLRAFR